MSPDQDVPSPVDFHDPAQAKNWEIETIRNRPWRPQFFTAFAEIIAANYPDGCTVLELGSGPGHLAEQLLSRCSIRQYVLLDFSQAMHDIARDRTAPFLEKVEFVTRDFREPDWNRGLGPFDAVVTMQAAHETRHKRHLPAFLRRAGEALKPGGLLLYCDHYAGDGKNPDLFPAADAQPKALLDAGFSVIRCHLDLGGMALFSARN